MSSSSTVTNNFLNKLDDLRDYGYSDAEIGNWIGVNRSTVYRWRTDRRAPLSASRRNKLSYRWRRTVFPRSIIHRMRTDLITPIRGPIDPQQIFTNPVTSGKVPLKVRGVKVRWARIKMVIDVVFEDGEKKTFVTGVSQMRNPAYIIRPNRNLNDLLFWDEIGRQLMIQLSQISDSKKISEATVKQAHIELYMEE